MNDLTNKEQKAVRTALRFLRLRVGAWGPLAKALRYEWDRIQKVAIGKRAVTSALARAGGRAPCRPVALAPRVPPLRPPAGRLHRRRNGHRVNSLVCARP